MVLFSICIFLSCVTLLFGAVIGREKSKDEEEKSIKVVPKVTACKQRVSGFHSHNIKINEKCKKGQIHWNLTTKHLDLSFELSDMKELCFSSTAPSGLEKYEVFKRTGQGLEKLGTPKKGVDTCIVIQKGESSFRINPTGQYYGLYVRYTLVA